MAEECVLPKPDETLDVRDKACPMPVLMTKRRLTKTEIGKVIEVVMNDPTTKTNILRYAWNHGQEILQVVSDPPEHRIYIKRQEDKKVGKPLPVVGPCGERWD